MRIISFFLGQKSHKLYVYFIFEIYLFINKSFSNYMQPAGTYDRMHSIHLNNKKKKNIQNIIVIKVKVIMQTKLYITFIVYVR